MSEICFVNIGNIYTAPFLKVYTNVLNKPYDLIYWNRDLIMENCDAENIYSFDYAVKKNGDKFIGYLKFSHYCKKIFKKNKYSKVVFLGTISCIINFFNIKLFDFDYIIDVRDYTLEKNALFYKIEDICFKNAVKIVISSPAYKEFLPKKYEYLEIHNIQKVDYHISKKEKKIPLNISFIGTITYIDENIKIINTFANDDRFTLNFIGKNSEIIAQYCEKNNIKNVLCKGRFNPSEIVDYYEECDVILNAYGNNTPHLDYALSNKLYFSIFMQIPIIVNNNTYMEKVSSELGLGIVYDNNSLIKEEILQFSLDEIKRKKIEKYGDDLLKINRESEECIKNIINGKT